MELIGSNLDVVLRLLVAMVLGGTLGLERELAGKKAGMRTYALISVGSALFVVISALVTEKFVGISNFDPLRVASQIIVGIGFVGGGLIIFVENKVQGLTTAAGLWVAAGVGMASGFGLYVVAVTASAIALFIFIVLLFVDRKFLGKKLGRFEKRKSRKK